MLDRNCLQVVSHPVIGDITTISYYIRDIVIAIVEEIAILDLKRVDSSSGFTN